MMFNYSEVIVEDGDRDTVTEDESKPSGAGFTAKDVNRTNQAVWYLSAASESDTCTITPWYYDDQREAWCKGESKDLTGSSTFLQYHLGGAVDIQLTSVTGTWSASYRMVGQGS